MIETYKILHKLYDTNIDLKLPLCTEIRTRGNSLKLKVERSNHNVRQYSFSQRVVPIWNSLPDDLVSAPTLNSFKNGLDKFWIKQDFYFDYKSTYMNDKY